MPVFDLYTDIPSLYILVPQIHLHSRLRYRANIGLAIVMLYVNIDEHLLIIELNFSIRRKRVF